jgi:hypothetical protein
MMILHLPLRLDHQVIVMALVLQIRLPHHKLRVKWSTRIPAAIITAERKGTAAATASRVLISLLHLQGHFMQEVPQMGLDSVITASRAATVARSLLEDRKMKLVLQQLSSFSAVALELQGRDRSLFHLMFPRFHLYLRVTKAKPSFLAAQ